MTSSESGDTLWDHYEALAVTIPYSSGDFFGLEEVGHDQSRALCNDPLLIG